MKNTQFSEVTLEQRPSQESCISPQVSTSLQHPGYPIVSDPHSLSNPSVIHTNTQVMTGNRCALKNTLFPYSIQFFEWSTFSHASVPKLSLLPPLANSGRFEISIKYHIPVEALIITLG